MYSWQSCDLAGPVIPGFEDREISASAEARGPLSDDVFAYPLVDTWRDRFWTMIADLVTDEVRAAFVRRPPEFLVSDDLTWLDEVILEATGKAVDMRSLVPERLSREYRVFRAAHATRTNDLAPYYTLGLRRLRAADVEARARTLFLNGQFQHGTEARLQEAIADLEARNPAGGRDGRLWFAANEPSLYSRSGGSGQYLVYGSEYLYCLGIRVIGVGDTKHVLKSIGRPTMFVCDIPMATMQSYTLRDFCGMAIEFLFSELLDDPENYPASLGRGSALSLIQDLPAEYIVGHYHPQAVYDPHWKDR